jgi:hypothetical protein
MLRKKDNELSNNSNNSNNLIPITEFGDGFNSILNVKDSRKQKFMAKIEADKLYKKIYKEQEELEKLKRERKELEILEKLELEKL